LASNTPGRISLVLANIHIPQQPGRFGSSYGNRNTSGQKKATEYLANERTFLAWIRTCIAVISLGFVIARFGVWLRELATQIAPKTSAQSTSLSLLVGVAMMALGSALKMVAAMRYHAINRAIDRGSIKPDKGLVIIVTVSVALLRAVMIAYLLFTAKHF
jgi:putative membrane protein